MIEAIRILAILGLILYNTAAFIILLDITVKRIGRREVLFILGILLISLFSIYIYYTSGMEVYAMYFPLIVQLPLFAIFFILSKYKGFKLAFVFLTVLICSSPILLISNTVSSFFEFSALSNAITKILLYMPLLYLIKRYFKPHFKFMLDNCDTGWALFCAVPFLTFTAAYINGRYRVVYDITEWKETAIWRYFISSIAFLSYILILMYFKKIKEQMEVKGTLELLQTKLDGTVQYISSLKSSQQQTDIYRHDLRHHLQLISSYALNQDYKAICDYAGNLEKSIDASEPIIFCKNDALNLILSAFKAKADMEALLFNVNINLDEGISIPDIDLCAIFSNALENAIKAAKEVTDRPREISLSCYTKNDQLFLEIKNSYKGNIEFENGIPKALNKEGGIGTKSIALIAEKHSGLYRFETVKDMFILSIILPTGSRA